MRVVAECLRSTKIRAAVVVSAGKAMIEPIQYNLLISAKNRQSADRETRGQMGR
jgi:hypothetical protein